MLYHYEFQLNTKDDRKLLMKLKDRECHDCYISENVSVVYIYSLVDSYIKYPNKKGKILYIGEACKHRNPTGLRFSQHIASKRNGAKGKSINYTLHKYYWNGFRMALDIIYMGNVTREERKQKEKDLIYSHIKKYGALPIAQGTSGILVDDIDKFDETKADEYFNKSL